MLCAKSNFGLHVVQINNVS